MQAFSPSKDQPASRRLARDLAGFFVWMANASNRDLLPQISELDLSLTQLKAMYLLGARADELSVKELAERLGLSLGATSRAVEGLVKRALVERDEDPIDRRVKRIRLTPRGRRTIDRLAAIRIRTLERLVETLSDSERTKLADALEPILAREDLARLPSRDGT